MRILVFAASNSVNSINKMLVQSVSRYYKEVDDEIRLLDLNDFEMPLFSKGREKAEGIPAAALRFAEQIDWADLILISFAENNGNYNVGYKNTMDWISRIPRRQIFENKAVFLLATSEGARGARTVLEIAESRMPRDGATVLDMFSLPEFSKNFQEGKGVITANLRSQLEAKVRKTKRLMAERFLSQ
ncbi:MAG: NADPH-dependent FMN reductase [Sphingobacterium sp.]